MTNETAPCVCGRYQIPSGATSVIGRATDRHTRTKCSWGRPGAEFECAARRGTTDPPQDCDWPVCGCDPHADKVVQHLLEAGCLRSVRDLAPPAETRADLAQEEPTQANRIEAAFRDGYDFGQADRRFDATDAAGAWLESGTRKALKATDPIAAAVDAQLDPLKDELITIGRKLAREETR